MYLKTMSNNSSDDLYDTSEDIIFDLKEEIKRLRNQVTYLQEELGIAEDVVETLKEQLRAYEL